MRQILKQLGFSEKEIDVYLTSLKLGSAPISELAKKACIKRPTTYVILERLEEKGLISLSEKKNKQIFVAQSPEKLLKLIEQQKEELADKEEEIKKALPNFKALAKEDTTIPLFKYYEGKESVWNIFDDIVESKQNASVIAAGEIYDILGLKRFTKNVVQKRLRLGTEARIIADQHPENIRGWEEKRDLVREYRFFPADIRFDTSIYIYANKVALIFLKGNLSGMIIENEKLSLAFKFMFDSLWKELEGKNLPEKKYSLYDSQKLYQGFRKHVFRLPTIS